MTMPETFEPLTLQEITTATAKEKQDKIDPVWKERISTVSVGNGFRLRRVLPESQRALKTRINHAAEASGRKLAWYPQSGVLEDGKPGSYVVKVAALLVSQNGSQASQETPQTTEGQNSENGTSEETAAVVRGRGR